MDQSRCIFKKICLFLFDSVLVHIVYSFNVQKKSTIAHTFVYFTFDFIDLREFVDFYIRKRKRITSNCHMKKCIREQKSMENKIFEDFDDSRGLEEISCDDPSSESNSSSNNPNIYKRPDR